MKTRIVVAAVGAFVCAGAALGQRTVTFDAGTVLADPPSALGITFQLYSPVSGVGFAWPVTPGAYVGGGVISMAGLGITSSGTRAVMTPTASAGFSEDGFRMLFAVPQTSVKFTVGAPEARTDFSRYVYRVRGYNAANVLVYSSDYSTGTTPIECRTQVEVTATAGNPVTRIDVLTLNPGVGGVLTNGGFTELFDTLVYAADATPPDVSVSVPGDDACVSDTSVTVTGYSYEPDGTYAGDTLEFSTQPDGPWTLVGSFTTPVVPPGGTLYNWNTAALPANWYYLRFTATNVDGLETVVVRRVYMDAAALGVDLRSPASGQVVGGSVCFDGTVTDTCSVNYTLEWRPAGAGAYTAFAVGTSVINDPLGSWNTLSPVVPDGTYDVRLTAVDGNANSTVVTRQLVVDNTAPVALLASPAMCSDVSGLVPIVGTASDAHLSGWTLQYSSAATGSWVTIASGNSPIGNNTLGVWDTRFLPACAYTVRLLVSDTATVNCNSSHTTERLLNLNVDQPGVCDDIDFNNDGLFPDTLDIQSLLSVFSGGACL